MNITIKNNKQIDDMRIGGKLLGRALTLLKESIKPGFNCLDLDKIFANFLKENNCDSNFKNYMGYPKYICVSINEQLIHGIPQDREIENGDIISIDAGLIYNDMHLDAAFTTICGKPKNEKDIELVKITKESLFLAIEQIKAGVRIGTLSSTVQKIIEEKGFHLPTAYCGHGIGYEMHEDPQIPNVGKEKTGIRLVKGMTICIEPMVQIGTPKTIVEKDQWTVRSADNSMAAHYEHTILVTEYGYEILTAWED
ncbi:type I methionyl aminopeptidase [Spiroplasma endosymbiont of Aspidapion aeneum]|uniref:type I methionyl aminopeptidase n=1 Tax=Spiroplasma endosymbiont of Aspidapion aeneum TaxID=3066276 RepID=UPI00313C1216